MKKLIIPIIASVIGVFPLASCGGSQKKTTVSQETTIEKKVSPIRLQMDSAFAAKESFGYIVDRRIIKDELVRLYGQKLYDILGELSFCTDPVSKEGEKYIAKGIGEKNSRSHVILEYDCNTERLTLDVMSHGNKYEKGHFLFNDNGWKLSYQENEWGEKDKSKPYIYYVKLSGNSENVNYGENAAFACFVFKEGNEYVIKVLSNLIGTFLTATSLEYKDNKGNNGTFYFDRTFNESRGSTVSHNIGGYIVSNNAISFLNRFSDIEKLSVIFRTDGEPTLVKDLKDFCNIRNAYYKYLVKDEEAFIKKITDSYGSDF